MKTSTFSATEFPLTHKNNRLIHYFAHNGKVPYDTLLQESLIVEWHLQESKKRRNRKHYFHAYRTGLFNSLLKIKTELYANRKLDVQGEDGEDGVSFIDGIIQLRPFNAIYYQHLCESLVQMIREFDVIASRMFIVRVQQEKKWKEIHREVFPNLTKNKFYGRVSLIKSVVSEYANCV